MSLPDPSSPPSKRRRQATKQVESFTSEEEKMMQQALKNSRVDVARNLNEIQNLQSGPVFYPTRAQFTNPMEYITAIQPEAEAYGICKIVPPEGWNPPMSVDMTSKKKFETKRQEVQRLQEGREFDDGRKFTPAEYQEMARGMTDKWKSERYPTTDMTPEDLEKDYWDIVGNDKIRYSAEYGNDIDCTNYWSGFPLSKRGRALNGTNEESHLPEPEFGSEAFYRETHWNLNNLPASPGSVLRHVKVPLNGVNVPWLYMGTLFSTFCWHNEDNYLYSINYHHDGAPKQWYGVPGTKKDADGLEKVFKNHLALKVKSAPDLLYHITTMISPILLRDSNVPVCKITQHPGEYVVTFPRAFHCGFSMGANIGEAVNFALPQWIAAGAEANERYRSFSKPTVFSHDRLTFTLAQYLGEHSLVSCKQLKQELERVLREERLLRKNLEESDIVDVSGSISLPKNNLAQLDEASADYDDKRRCKTCNHICFFSAVGCRCSQHLVSCLRHSSLMCRCPSVQKYLMVWATIAEIQSVLSSVERHCEILEKGDAVSSIVAIQAAASVAASALLKKQSQHANHANTNESTPDMVKDKLLHEGYFVPFPCPSAGSDRFPVVALKEVARKATLAAAASKVAVKEEEEDDEDVVIEELDEKPVEVKVEEVKVE